jgi:hypothetical protein
LARFERQEVTDDRLADTLGAATEQLRAALEREAVEIINKAREQAAGIEDVARQKADQVEQDARARAEELDRQARANADELEQHAVARAQEAHNAQSDRIAQLIDGVDALEDHIRTMLDDLRTEVRSVVEDVTKDRPAPEASPDIDASPAAGSDAEVAQAEPSPGDQAMAFAQPVPSRPAALSATAEAEEATERNPQLDTMMRAQLMSMRDSGRTRNEAERFLARFKSGASYIGLLDEFYPHHEEFVTPAAPKAKRRLLGRRRA